MIGTVWSCDSCGGRAPELFPDSWRIVHNPNVPRSERHVCDSCLNLLGAGVRDGADKGEKEARWYTTRTCRDPSDTSASRAIAGDLLAALEGMHTYAMKHQGHVCPTPLHPWCAVLARAERLVDAETP